MNIVIVGAGRVGTALSKALDRSGHNLLRIVSRSIEKAERLANIFGSEYGNDLVIPHGSEVVIVAVNDDSIYGVMKEIDAPDKTVIVHTAGSVGMDVFGCDILNHGVFYPLQTFTDGRDYNFREIPIFIEGNNDHTINVLNSLAVSVSESVIYLTSENRRYLHLAAVFVCNFVNHLYYAGKEISGHAGMEFKVLLPLLEETMQKASDLGPERSQTGPAVRNDKKTIEKHLDLLSFSPDLQKIYQVITDSIINKYTA